MSADRPNVFSIPPGAAFLPALADAIFAGTLVPGWPVAGDPLSLSEGTIFVPTRRAARSLAALIAERIPEGAVLLPRIVPLGDVDEAEEAQLFEALSCSFADDALLPPQASDIARRMVLARLILAWSHAVGRGMMGLAADEPLLVPSSPADAVALAGDLGMLIDSLSIHGRTVDDIHKLVPEQYSQYWDISRAFLTIAAEQWPAACVEGGVMDAALRRHKLLLAEAGRLQRDLPRAPVIAAGSTGSMPATAALLAAIARLPCGAVVLPGLDLYLDAQAWTAIATTPEDVQRDVPGGEGGHPSHPQAVLAELLVRLGIGRGSVRPIGSSPSALAARERFVSEALRPAETTHLWSTRHERLDPASVGMALEGIGLVEAADDREEATAIAVILREALEDPARTAALITPDRTLAARVSAELRRWDIRVDDSAGQPLGHGEAGLLARLVAQAAASNFDAQDLLALTAHPMCRVGLPRATLDCARAALEIGVLRGPALEPGLGALRAALPAARAASHGHHAKRPQKRLGGADWAALDALVGGLQDAFAGFTPADHSGMVDLATLPVLHEQALTAIGRPAAGEDGGAFAGISGEGLAAFFDELKRTANANLAGRFDEYPPFFDGLMAGRVVRRTGETHRRVRIWGLLEARLLSCDVAVLGGLDEKTWPAETRGDAFLNRPMRRDLGLPAPERRIGQMAHDFTQALGAPIVFATRALKRGGDPTVPSRFIQRMQAVAGKDAWADVVERGRRPLALARQLDRVGAAKPVRRPAPLPPPDRVPMSLSVTEIETLVRDPYAVYARHVLELDPLEAVAVEPNAALMGNIVHEVMSFFVEKFPAGLPPGPLAELTAIGRNVFDATPELRDHKDVYAAWWGRFVRMAGWLAQWEPARREGSPVLKAEISGSLPVPLANGATFTLRGRLDRIELHPGGRFRVVDFKTGASPSVKEVRVGFSPQLTLEAAMAKGGAFKDVPGAETVDELLYVKLSGAGVPGQEKPVRDKNAPFDVDELADEHLVRLAQMMSEYAAGERKFVSRPYAKFAKRYAPYDHLARVREWSLVGGDGEDGGE